MNKLKERLGTCSGLSGRLVASPSRLTLDDGVATAGADAEAEIEWEGRTVSLT